MWRSQGATLVRRARSPTSLPLADLSLDLQVSIKLITAYRALLVGLESIMEVSGTLDHTTRPEFVNRCVRSSASCRFSR